MNPPPDWIQTLQTVSSVYCTSTTTASLLLSPLATRLIGLVNPKVGCRRDSLPLKQMGRSREFSFCHACWNPSWPKSVACFLSATLFVCSNLKGSLKCVSRLSRRGKTVIFSIHQPRYSIFRQFDHLTLMHKGEVVYAGAAGHALEYFTDLGNVCVFTRSNIHGDQSCRGGFSFSQILFCPPYPRGLCSLFIHVLDSGNSIYLMSILFYTP